MRDVRRLIVAMSRARLGLYIFGRIKLFKSCFELTPVFNILTKRPQALHLATEETLYPTKRVQGDDLAKRLVVADMPQMAQYVFDFYQSKLQSWNKLQKITQETEESSQSNDKTQANKDRIKKLDEEEKVLREKLGNIIFNILAIE